MLYSFFCEFFSPSTCIWLDVWYSVSQITDVLLPVKDMHRLRSKIPHIEDTAKRYLFQQISFDLWEPALWSSPSCSAPALLLSWDPMKGAAGRRGWDIEQWPFPLCGGGFGTGATGVSLMCNVCDLAGQNYSRLTKWVWALPVGEQAWLVSVVVSNKWKGRGMTVGPLMPCTSESFSKRTSAALEFRSSFARAMLVQGKSGHCLHLFLSQAIHSPRSGARIVLPASMPRRFEWNHHATCHLCYSLTSCGQVVQVLSSFSECLAAAVRYQIWNGSSLQQIFEKRTPNLILSVLE